MRRRAIWATLILAACSHNPKPAPAPVPPSPVPAPRPTVATLKLGVIVSREASAANRDFDDMILDGVRVAAAAHAGQAVDVIVREDSGRASRSAAALKDLEGNGVVAVIGPSSESGFNAAAAARTSPDLVLIAPAITHALRTSNAYALNVEDTAGAALLGRYAATLKLRVGIIAASGASAADIAAFTHSYATSGGGAVTTATYATGITTFAAPVRKLRDAHVQLVYMPITAREIPQVLPQLGYYGLDGVKILGGEAFTTPNLSRSVPAALLNDVVAATVLPRTSADVAWSTFEGLYEQTYKRSLQSPIPALGYDAARIVLDAPPRGNASRADVARAVAREAPVKGATGVLRITPGAVSRTAFLVRYRNGSWDQIPATGAQ